MVPGSDTTIVGFRAAVKDNFGDEEGLMSLSHGGGGGGGGGERTQKASFRVRSEETKKQVTKKTIQAAV